MKEKWMSEKEALDKFGQTDLDKHCASGRVHWREILKGKQLVLPRGPGPKAKSTNKQKKKLVLGITSWKRSCALCSWSKPLERGLGS